MKVPILVNARNVVRSWPSGESIEPEVKFTGYGPELDMTVVEQLVSEIKALTESLPATDDGRREFDQRASKLLGQRLALPPAVAADRRFWQWLSITQAEEIVLWRWKKRFRETVSLERWLGGWKDTFRRLWLRANVIQEETAGDPFELAGRGDEDFWVGILERDIAGCRVLVKTLVRRFFSSEGGTVTASSQRMLHYRGTIKRLRQIRPNRVYEQMSQPEIETLVQEAMTATVPDGLTHREKRKKHSRKAKAKRARRRR